MTWPIWFMTRPDGRKALARILSLGGAWRKAPMPVTVFMSFEHSTAYIFKDGKMVDGWMSRFEWFLYCQKKYDEAQAKAKAAVQDTVNKQGLYVVT